MSLWYACKCKICEKEYSVEYYSSKESERFYCKDCLPLLQKKKRKEYFNNSQIETSNMKRIIAVFSFTDQGARDKAFKLIHEHKEAKNVKSYNNKIETDKSIYTLYVHGTQMNGVRFHEAHVNDLFSVRYVNHIKQGLTQQRDMNSRIYYFMSDDELE